MLTLEDTDDEAVGVAEGLEEEGLPLVDFQPGGLILYRSDVYSCQVVPSSFPFSIAKQLNSSCHLFCPARSFACNEYKYV